MPHLRHPIFYRTSVTPGSVSQEQISEEFEAPMVSAELVARISNGTHNTIAHSIVPTSYVETLDELLESESSSAQQGELGGYLDFSSRSGLSRVGQHVDIVDSQMLPDSDQLQCKVNIFDLRSGGAHSMLRIFRELVAEENGRVNTGDLILVPNGTVRNGEQAKKAEEDGEIFLPPDSEIRDDGIIEVPISPDVHFGLQEHNFTDRRMREVFSRGKHSLVGIQSPFEGLPETIEPKQLVVGAMNLSLGPHSARIIGTNKDDVFHLSAKFLHGIRTTGMNYWRHLELYNKGEEPVQTADLRILLELLRADPETTRIWKMGLVSRRAMVEGVTLNDLYSFNANIGAVTRTMQGLSSNKREDAAYGYLVGPGRVMALDWMNNIDEQNRHITEATETQFLADSVQPGSPVLRNGSIPHHLRGIASMGRFVGGEQNQNRMLITHSAPQIAIMQQLHRSGVGTFVMKHVSESDDMFTSDEEPSKNNQTFSALRYQEFRGLEKSGANIHLAMDSSVDKFRKISDDPEEYEVVPAHMLKFYRGLWVREEDIERMDKVQLPIAFYGSNLDAVNPVLREQLADFMKKLKEKYGEKVAVVHGKGPGVMFESDEAASNEGIFRIGVGISVESKGQKSNPGPEAGVEFFDRDRLARQQLMDDMTAVKIFNIGGGGTLEEAAISICSQKLRNNIPAPLIFVDVAKRYQSKGHLWDDLKQQVEKLCSEWQIEGDDGQPIDIDALMDAWVYKTIELKRSYDEAFDVLSGYTDKTEEYLKKIGISQEHYEEAYTTAQSTRAVTEFPEPWYVPKPTEVNLAA